MIFTPQYNTLWYLNDKAVSKDKFDHTLEIDLANEQTKCTWNRTSVIYRDLGEGYEVEVNGNFYRYGEEAIYDSALSLIGDFIENGNRTQDLFDALLKMPEESLKLLALMLDDVSELENGDLRYEQ